MSRLSLMRREQAGFELCDGIFASTSVFWSSLMKTPWMTVNNASQAVFMRRMTSLSVEFPLSSTDKWLFEAFFFFFCPATLCNSIIRQGRPRVGLTDAEGACRGSQNQPRLQWKRRRKKIKRSSSSCGQIALSGRKMKQTFITLTSVSISDDI